MKSKVLFLHIPKTGGRKINHLLRRFFTEETYIDHIESVEYNNLLGVLGNKNFISGHYSYIEFKNILNDFANWSVITFVREPYAHLISHISWVRNLSFNKKKYDKHSIKIKLLNQKYRKIDFTEPSQLIEYVNRMDEYEFKLFENSQLRYLSGPKNKSKTDIEDLNLAMKNLENIFYCGVFENFERSVKELFIKFGINFDKVSLTSKINNQTHKIINNIHNKPELKKILYPLVEKDLILYEKAKLVKTM